MSKNLTNLSCFNRFAYPELAYGYEDRLRRSYGLMTWLSHAVSAPDATEDEPAMPWTPSDHDDTAESMAQATYLMDRDGQRRAFLNKGYMVGTPQDYGLVRNAAEAMGKRRNELVPVYQTRPDDAEREQLVHLGNILADDGDETSFADRKRRLVNAETRPTAYYLDTEGNPYAKSWDMNDYGLYNRQPDRWDYGLKNYGAALLDGIGSPVVVTTGYGLLDFLPTEMEDRIKGRNISYQDTTGRYGYSAPEVTVAPKAFGGNLFYDGGDKDDNGTMVVDMSRVGGLPAISDPRYFIDNSMNPLPEVEIVAPRVEKNDAIAVRKPLLSDPVEMGELAAERAVRNREIQKTKPAEYQQMMRDRNNASNLLWLHEHPDRIAQAAGLAADAIDLGMAGAQFFPGIGRAASNTYFGLKGVKDLSDGNYLQGSLELSPLLLHSISNTPVVRHAIDATVDGETFELPGLYWSVGDDFVPRFLKAPSISADDIFAVGDRARKSYEGLPTKFGVDDIPIGHTTYFGFRKMPNPRDIKVTLLENSEFDKRFPSHKGASAFSDGKDGIYVRTPTVVFPWERNVYRRNLYGTIAHEFGHKYQVSNNIPTPAFQYMLLSGFKPYNQRYWNGHIWTSAPFTKRAINGYPYTADANARNYNLWNSATDYGRWENSPNEFLSEMNLLKEMGFVRANGKPNNVGYNYLTDRFNTDRGAIDEALDALERNGEYLPVQVVPETKHFNLSETFRQAFDHALQ